MRPWCREFCGFTMPLCRYVSRILSLIHDLVMPLPNQSQDALSGPRSAIARMRAWSRIRGLVMPLGTQGTASQIDRDDHVRRGSNRSVEALRCHRCVGHAVEVSAM